MSQRLYLVRMVPPRLPKPGLLVTVTGVLEFLGAVGLLVPALIHASAYALILLLVARAHLLVAGRPATPLVIRLPLQLFWIGTLWWVSTVS